MSDNAINDQLVLIGGESGMGKSMSLRNLQNQENWMYLNCEAGKRLPFRNKFRSFKITDPYQVMEAMDHARDNPDVHGVIIDTLTFLMDMFESQYVIGSSNTMDGWSRYQQFFKELMQDKIANLGKPVLILAHVREDLDEKNMEMKSSVPIKGALKNNGIEAYFSTVVYTKKVSMKELEGMESPLLNISEEEKELGFKHVFQTRVTKKTLGTRIRAPLDLFSRQETFIDNDAHKLLERLKEYYGD